MDEEQSATDIKGKRTRGAWANLPALNSRQLCHPEHDRRRSLKHITGKTIDSWIGTGAKSFSLTLLLVVTVQSPLSAN